MLVKRNDLAISKGHTNADFQVFSLNSGDGKNREYRKRRAHAKTHSGCLTCRTKRVKVGVDGSSKALYSMITKTDTWQCDELRPVCARCCRNDRSCVYESSKKARYRPEEFSVLKSVSIIPYSVLTARNGTPSSDLMQHMERQWIEIFNFPCTDEVLTLFKSYPLVRNTILAVAACHLRNMSPQILQHRIAEHFQQALALQDYQELMFMSADELGQPGVNAMMFSAVLLKMLAFALPASEVPSEGEPDISTSWLFSPREDSLRWLALQEGLRHLLKTTATYLSPAMSFLGEIFLGPGDDPWKYSTLPSTPVDLPKSWVEFLRPGGAASNGGCTSCDSRGSPDEQIRVATSSPRRNVLEKPALALTRSLKDSSTGLNIFHNFTFLSKVDAEFRTSLYQRDERTVWLFGYWLGLMSHHQNLWWCGKRIRRDYMAVRIWLEQARVTARAGAEGELWREMMAEFENAAFPAGCMLNLH